MAFVCPYLQSFITEFFFCKFNWKGNPEKGVMKILKSIFSATCSSSWYVSLKDYTYLDVQYLICKTDIHSLLCPMLLMSFFSFFITF